MYYVNLIKPVRKAGRGISPRLRSRDYSVDDLLATQVSNMSPAVNKNRTWWFDLLATQHNQGNSRGVGRPVHFLPSVVVQLSASIHVTIHSFMYICCCVCSHPRAADPISARETYAWSACTICVVVVATTRLPLYHFSRSIYRLSAIHNSTM
jgi:hypothetical protein